MTQSIEDETKAREISFHERLAASERKSNSPQVTRGIWYEPRVTSGELLPRLCLILNGFTFLYWSENIKKPNQKIVEAGIYYINPFPSFST